MASWDDGQSGLPRAGTGDLERRDRVRDHTPASVNRRIDEAARTSVARASGSAGGVAERLACLDREWDVDRTLMLLFPILGGVTLLTGLRKGRTRANGWLALFGVQVGFMAWHSLVGWCPPMAVLRRLGVRTQKEIAEERFALLHERAAATPCATRPPPLA